MLTEYSEIKDCMMKEIPLLTQTSKNLSDVVGCAMVDKYGNYNIEDEEEFEQIIGLKKGTISRIIHDGKISVCNFNDLCSYLNTPIELEMIWYELYVEKDESFVNKTKTWEWKRS